MSGPRRKAAARPPPIPLKTGATAISKASATTSLSNSSTPPCRGEYRMTMDPSEKDALLYVPNAGLTLAEQMGLSSKTARFQRTDGTHMGSPLGGTAGQL